MVFALNPANAPANLQTGGDELQREIKLPQNTAHIYLDVFPQSQFHDEFWYTCLPEKYIPETTPFAMKRGYKGGPEASSRLQRWKLPRGRSIRGRPSRRSGSYLPLGLHGWH